MEDNTPNHPTHQVGIVPVQVAADRTLVPCLVSTTGDTARVEFWTGWCHGCGRVISDLPVPGTAGLTDLTEVRALVGPGRWSAWEHWFTRAHAHDLDTGTPTVPARVYETSSLLRTWGHRPSTRPRLTVVGGLSVKETTSSADISTRRDTENRGDLLT